MTDGTPGEGSTGPAVRRPAGDVYDWLSRGRDLLATGDAGAAAILLRHARDAEPASREVAETLARAEFESGRFVAARDMFAVLVELAPDSDYARFGLGASLVRLGRHRDALPHLTMATVMRPDKPEYAQLLERARAATAGPTTETTTTSTDADAGEARDQG